MALRDATDVYRAAIHRRTTATRPMNWASRIHPAQSCSADTRTRVRAVLVKFHSS